MPKFISRKIQGLKAHEEQNKHVEPLTKPLPVEMVAIPTPKLPPVSPEPAPLSMRFDQLQFPGAEKDASLVEGGVSSGNILANDERPIIGQTNSMPPSYMYDSVKLTSVNIEGKAYDFKSAQTDAAGKFLSVNTAYGVLKVYDDGKYTYVEKPGATPPNGYEVQVDYTSRGEQTGAEYKSSLEVIKASLNAANAPINDLGNDKITISDQLGQTNASEKGNLLTNDNMPDGSKIVSVEIGGKTYSFDPNSDKPVVVSVGGYNLEVYKNGTYSVAQKHVDPNQITNAMKPTLPPTELKYTIDTNGSKTGGFVSSKVVIQTDKIEYVITPQPTTKTEAHNDVIKVGGFVTKVGSDIPSRDAVKGNILTNDTLAPGAKLASLSYDGKMYSFDKPSGTDADGKFLLIDTAHGMFKVYQSGAYSYRAEALNDTTLAEKIGYVLSGPGNGSRGEINIEIGAVTHESPIDFKTTITMPYIAENDVGVIHDGLVSGNMLANDHELFSIIKYDDNSFTGSMSESPKLATPAELINNALLSITVDGKDYTFKNAQTDAIGRFISVSAPFGVLKVYDDGRYTYMESRKAPDGYELNVDYKATGNGNPYSGHLEVIKPSATIDDAPDNDAGHDDIHHPMIGHDGINYMPGDVKGNLLDNDGLPAASKLVRIELDGKTYDFSKDAVFENGAKVMHIPTVAGVINIFEDGRYTMAGGWATPRGNGISELHYVVDTNGNKAGGFVESSVTIHQAPDYSPIDLDLEAATEDRSLAALGGLLNATGNVLANDLLLPTTKLTGVSIGGVILSFNQPTGTDADGKFVLVEGQHGTLKMYQNGNYSYTAVDGVGSSEHFEYLLTHANGVVDRVPLTIDITFICTFPGFPVEPEITLDPIFIKGYAPADAVDDRIAAHSGEVIKGNLLANDKAAEEPVQRDDHKPTIVSFEYAGKVYNFQDLKMPIGEHGKLLAIDTMAGKLIVHEDGYYTFQANNVNFFREGGVIEDKLTYTIEQNGHKDTATVNIIIENNGELGPPKTVDYELTPDVGHANMGSNATGNVLENDYLPPGVKLSGLSMGGVTISFSTPSGVDADGKFVLINGQNGMLKMYENGNYNYTVENVPSTLHEEHFNYQVTDLNGVVSHVPLTIEVTPTVDNNTADDVPRVFNPIDTVFISHGTIDYMPPTFNPIDGDGPDFQKRMVEELGPDFVVPPRIEHMDDVSVSDPIRFSGEVIDTLDGPHPLEPISVSDPIRFLGDVIDTVDGPQTLEPISVSDITRFSGEVLDIKNTPMVLSDLLPEHNSLDSLLPATLAVEPQTDPHVFAVSSITIEPTHALDMQVMHDILKTDDDTSAV